MNTLESLVNKVIDRIRPQSLAEINQKKKTSLILSTATAIVASLSSIYWIYSGLDNEPVWLMMLLTIIPLSGAAILLQDYFFKKNEYKKFMDMNASNYNRYYIYKYNGHIVLNDDEAKQLLEMDFSEKNLAILHNAISRGSYIIFDELADMYEQQIKEDRFVSNQAKLVEKGLYRNDKQQKTFQNLNAISAVKINYKTFNSKSVL